jgi:hypothetical protein
MLSPGAGTLAPSPACGGCVPRPWPPLPRARGEREAEDQVRVGAYLPSFSDSQTPTICSEDSAWKPTRLLTP